MVDGDGDLVEVTLGDPADSADAGFTLAARLDAGLSADCDKLRVGKPPVGETAANAPVLLDTAGPLNADTPLTVPF